MAADRADTQRFAEDFLAALRLGQWFRGLTVNDIVEAAGVSRSTYYALLDQLHVPRLPTAAALAAAVGWRMDLLITPTARPHAARPLTERSLRGHPLPQAPTIAAYARKVVPTIRQQAAAALLIGLARRGWSLRRAACAAQMRPTQPFPLLVSLNGPDPHTLARLMRPLGFTVSIRYRPWGAPDPPTVLRPTPAMVRKVRRRNAATIAVLVRLDPSLAEFLADPDATTIRAAYGTIPAAAAQLGVTASWLRTLMKRLHISVPSNPLLPLRERRKRDRQILQAARTGQSAAAIAARYGLTRARIHQIVKST